MDFALQFAKRFSTAKNCFLVIVELYHTISLGLEGIGIKLSTVAFSTQLLYNQNMFEYNTYTCGNRKEVADSVTSFVLYSNIQSTRRKPLEELTPLKAFCVA